jgi:hypothetical protein
MTKYYCIAKLAIEKINHNVLDPLTAWIQSCEQFNCSESEKEKTCPKNTFLWILKFSIKLKVKFGNLEIDIKYDNKKGSQVKNTLKFCIVNNITSDTFVSNKIWKEIEKDKNYNSELGVLKAFLDAKLIDMDEGFEDENH